MRFAVGRPSVANWDDFYARVEAIKKNQWFTNNGPMVQEFEQSVGEFTKTECIAFSNATVAMELSLRALKLPGRSVAVPKFTFPSTIHAPYSLGCKLNFYDLTDPSTPQLGRSIVNCKAFEDSDAIIVANLFGDASHAFFLEEWAQKNGKILIFDSAHCLTSTVESLDEYGLAFEVRPVGGFGHLEIFSCHATKHLQSFEGGLVTTRDPELARSLRLMRSFGYGDSYGDRAIHNYPVAWGTNAKLSEIHAAMGLSNWKYRRDLYDHFELIQNTYRNHLKHKYMLEQSSGSFPGYVSLIDVQNRDEIMRRMATDHQIELKRYFYPACDQLPPYSIEYPSWGGNASLLSRSILQLPTGLTITFSDAKEIAETLNEVIAKEKAERI